MITRKWQICIMPAERRWIDMLLSPDASLCEKNQAIVVSRDKGKVEHRAINPQGQFDLRHYQLDGALIKQTKCCDYLLINDSRRKAYFIELKGYVFFYRIVCTKARTHKVQDPKFRKFKEKCGPRLQMKVNCLEEKLD